MCAHILLHVVCDLWMLKMNFFVIHVKIAESRRTTFSKRVMWAGRASVCGHVEFEVSLLQFQPF